MKREREDELRALGPVDPSGALDARVRRQARAELSLASRPAWRALASRAFTRVALPAAIAVTAVGYLHWAVEAVNALHR